jgi:hypothetical protein
VWLLGCLELWPGSHRVGSAALGGLTQVTSGCSGHHGAWCCCCWGCDTGFGGLLVVEMQGLQGHRVGRPDTHVTYHSDCGGGAAAGLRHTGRLYAHRLERPVGGGDATKRCSFHIYRPWLQVMQMCVGWRCGLTLRQCPCDRWHSHDPSACVCFPGGDHCYGFDQPLVLLPFVWLRVCQRS